MSGIPDRTVAVIESHLTRIAESFKPGAKLTLLVRNDVGPDLDADAVFTNDTLPAAIAGLQRRHALDTGEAG